MRRGLFCIFSILLYLTTYKETAKADWTSPINLGPPGSSISDEWYPSTSTLENFIVLKTARDTRAGLFVSAKSDGVWGPLEYITIVGNPSNLRPSISQDGREVYFSACCGGYGDHDIWKTVYDTISHSWGVPVNLGPNVNAEWGQGNPFLSYDGQNLYFVESSFRFDGVVVSHWNGSEWSYPELVFDMVFFLAESVSLTMDENEMYIGAYSDNRWRVFYSHNDSTENWTYPVSFAPINDHGVSGYPRVNADGSRVYFFSSFPGTLGGYDVWYVEKIPLGIKEEENGDSIKFNIYPNPTNTNFKIEAPSDFQGKVVIYDILGKKVDESEFYWSFFWPGSSERDLSLNSGIYYFRLVNDKGATVGLKKGIILK
jgi:hypothetical protein